jgi:hypothetical protein
MWERKRVAGSVRVCIVCMYVAGRGRGKVEGGALGVSRTGTGGSGPAVRYEVRYGIKVMQSQSEMKRGRANEGMREFSKDPRLSEVGR